MTVNEERRSEVRAEGIAMIFQDALSALNPVFTVGFQIEEQLRVRLGMSRRDARARAIELLDLVRIPNAARRVRQYPHQFSGGMRQRAMIAMSLALDPELLIADEPTTALDVTVQAQIMDLLEEIQAERQMGLVLITHDLGVVAEVADRIAVMYAGRIVEHADAVSLFRNPGHPYTAALMDSLPRLDQKGTDPEHDQGAAAEPAQHPAGLPVPPALPDGGGPVHAPRCRRTTGSGSAARRKCHFAEELVTRV